MFLFASLLNLFLQQEHSCLIRYVCTAPCCHNAEYHFAEWHNSECHFVECHNAECHFAEWHNAECHFAEWHNAECHFAECHNAECHFAECHFAECHFAECHNAECHFAECHNAECRGFIRWRVRSKTWWSLKLGKVVIDKTTRWRNDLPPPPHPPPQKNEMLNLRQQWLWGPILLIILRK
jgi:hypothetical protein